MSRTTWGIAVATMVLSMAARAIAVISAMSTGPRRAGRVGVCWAGWGGAVMYRPAYDSGSSAAGPAAAGQRVRAHRGHQHQGKDQVLRGRAHPEQVDAVVDGGDDEAAEHP